jgi:2-oxoacid:acceptor oxidoreductase gamma subunit (pyruvate/2-ketoisovalerate family)
MLKSKKKIGENMQLYVRWHSRAGQGAVTGAKALAEVMSQQGKYVQAYSVYGAEKRGAPMMAFDKISDEPINDHSKGINPGMEMPSGHPLTQLKEVQRIQTQVRLRTLVKPSRSIQLDLI